MICARIFADAGADWIDWYSVGLFHVPSVSTSITIWPAPGTADSDLRDTFDRRLYPLLLQQRGFQALHASAVEFPGAGVVAFTGRSGAGKSTLAFALARQGLTQIADDALVFAVADGDPAVVALPYRPQLRGAAASLATPPGGSSSSGRIIPLRMVFVLRQDAELDAPALNALAGPAACIELLSHAHVFDLSVDAARLVADYAALVNALPVIDLAYRPAIEELSELLKVIQNTVVERTGCARTDTRA